LALRILSAVQYLRASSGGVSTLCFVTLFDGVDFEKRFHAARYTPTIKHRRVVPTKGRKMSLCCRDMMDLSFRKDGMGRMLSYMSFSSLHVPETALAKDQDRVSSKEKYSSFS
jgi:hypothetical protein